MVEAEFLLIAFVVGLLTKTWLGFLGTFFGLYVLYRFTPLSTVLSLALSIYWGLVGYQLGAASGEIGVGPLLAVVGFVVAAGVHQDGFVRLAAWLGRLEPAPPFGGDGRVASYPEAQPVRAPVRHDEGRVIDVEYRVVS